MPPIHVTGMLIWCDGQYVKWYKPNAKLLHKICVCAWARALVPWDAHDEYLLKNSTKLFGQQLSTDMEHVYWVHEKKLFYKSSYISMLSSLFHKYSSHDENEEPCWTPYWDPVGSFLIKVVHPVLHFMLKWLVLPSNFPLGLWRNKELKLFSFDILAYFFNL